MDWITQAGESIIIVLDYLTPLIMFIFLNPKEDIEPDEKERDERLGNITQLSSNNK